MNSSTQVTSTADSERLLHRSKAALVPFILIVLTLLSLIVVRRWGGRSTGTEMMQVEMNKQYDRFQAELSKNTDALVQMQRRLVHAEKAATEIRTLFDASQKELLSTQKALASTQVALSRSQATITNLEARAKRAASAAPPFPGANDPRLEELANARRDLQKLRVEVESAEKAVAANRAVLRQTWEAYTEVQRATDLERRRISGASQELTESQIPAAPMVPAARPIELPREPASEAVGDHIDWNRLALSATADRLLALQTELEQLMGHINETNAAIIEERGRLTSLQRQAAQVQK
jgi:hypothetical protein